MPRRRWTIRIARAGLLLAAAAVLLGAAANAVVAHLGGAWKHQPEEAPWLLSEKAQALIDDAYADLDGPVRDHRVLLLSLGQIDGEDYDNRSFVHERFLRGWNPRARLYGGIYRGAAGVGELGAGDAEYLARLIRLARGLPGEHRIRLAALDQRYDREGRPLSGATLFHVDNDYVMDIARRHPDLFEPVVSVHPFRAGAAAALADWAERGARAVYWWPAAQGFDPADEALDPYYRALAENDLTLLARTGGTGGLVKDADNRDNPWHYRRALERGVRVVLAYGGGTAEYPDPAAEADANGGRPRISGLAMFMRLVRESGEDGELYADIGALAQRGRIPESLAELLQHPDVFDRLVYASGYPLPAINGAVDIDALAEYGFVTRDQAAALGEIYDVNPLLFDFVLKRLIRLPHTDLGLPGDIFTRDVFAAGPS